MPLPGSKNNFSRQTKKLVIFDDDEDIISICHYVLEDKGWEIFAFTDCNDPVEKVNEILPDVILMDNWIPDCGGVAATQKIKSTENLKTIPVIYFSANTEIEILADVAGADAYLPKPFSLDRLEQLILKITGTCS